MIYTNTKRGGRLRIKMVAANQRDLRRLEQISKFRGPKRPGVPQVKVIDERDSQVLSAVIIF